MNYQKIRKPKPGEYDPYFNRYIDLVGDTNIIQSLADQFEDAKPIYNSLDSSQVDFRYAAGKWSIKEVVIHIMDTERIFCNRALRISRNDQTPLPGFEQDDFINNTNWQNFKFSAVVEEMKLVRRHTILFFSNMTEEMLQRSGISSGEKLSVCAIPFILAGHEIHHLDVIKSRYL